MDNNNSKEIRGKMDKEIEDILNSILDKKQKKDKLKKKKMKGQ